MRCAKDKQQLAAAQQPPPLTLQQELSGIARGGATLGWSGHDVHEAARSAEGVVSSSFAEESVGLIPRDVSQVAYHISNSAAYSVDTTGLNPQIEYEPAST